MREMTETEDSGSRHLWQEEVELGTQSPEVSDVRGIGL